MANMNGQPLRVLVSSGSNEGSLELENGDFIEVGSNAWTAWLDTHLSFRFESGFAGEHSFTARKHERDSGEFWYAYRKLGKRLCNAYLGKSDRLNVERMLEVAAKLSHPAEPKNPSQQLGNSYAKITGVTCWNVYERVKGEDEWNWVGSHKTEYAASSQIDTRKDHNHRMNSMNDYGVVSLEWEKRSEVILPAINGYAPECITSSNKLEASEKLAELEADNAKLRDQLDDMAARAGEWYDKAKVAEREIERLQSQSHDLEAVRDRILLGLRVGKQAPEYKRTKAAIDRFIAQLLESS